MESLNIESNERLAVSSMLKLIDNMKYEDEKKLVDILFKKHDKNIYHVFGNEHDSYNFHISANCRSDAALKICKSTDFEHECDTEKSDDSREMLKIYMREFAKSYSCERVDIEQDLDVKEIFKDLENISSYNYIILDVLCRLNKNINYGYGKATVGGEFIWSIIRNAYKLCVEKKEILTKLNDIEESDVISERSNEVISERSNEVISERSSEVIFKRIDISHAGFRSIVIDLGYSYPNSTRIGDIFHLREGNEKISLREFKFDNYFDIDDFKTDNIEELVNYFTFNNYDIIDKLWKDKDISNVLNKKFKVRQQRVMKGKTTVDVRTTDRYKEMISSGYTEIV